MKYKIQAIFLKLVRDLKRQQWMPSPDWEITLKSENNVSFKKNIPVSNYIKDQEITENILTTIDIKMISTDEITYFPEYIIYATITVDGATSEDLTFKSEGNAAFTEHDYNNDDKIKKAASGISRAISEYIDGEFNDYCVNHGQEIGNMGVSNTLSDDNEE